MTMKCVFKLTNILSVYVKDFYQSTWILLDKDITKLVINASQTQFRED